MQDFAASMLTVIIAVALPTIKLDYRSAQALLTNEHCLEHNGWLANGKMILMDVAFLNELEHILLDEDDNDESSD